MTDHKSRRFGLTFDEWKKDLDAALRFHQDKQSADYPESDLLALWDSGQLPSEAARQLWERENPQRRAGRLR